MAIGVRFSASLLGLNLNSVTAPLSTNSSVEGNQIPDSQSMVLALSPSTQSTWAWDLFKKGAN